MVKYVDYHPNMAGLECKVQDKKQKKNKQTNKFIKGAGWRLISAQVKISQFCKFDPHIRLCADSTEPAWDSPSLSVPAPTCTLSVSLKISKWTEKKKKLIKI